MAKFKLRRAGVIEEIAESVRRGLTLEAAAARAGVHRSTLHRWRNAPLDSDDGDLLRSLSEAVDGAVAENQAALVDAAFRLALAGDGQMIRFLLERRHGWTATSSESVASLQAATPDEPVRYVVTIPIVERISGPFGRDPDPDGVQF
jgi:transcriptional regulator with XRE-family HTH domain